MTENLHDSLPQKLIIFDVDGTLMMNGTVVKEAFQQAFLDVTGKEPLREGVVFAGMTDKGIFRQLMEAAHVSSDMNGTYERFVKRFIELMEQNYHLVDSQYLLPGVRELLEELDHRDNVIVALGTGNVRATCYIKLQYFKIDQYFTIGGFGGDYEYRPDLVRAAIEEARAIYGWDGNIADDVWVVGDTPNDVIAGKENGTRVLAVASGIIPKEQLINTDADVLLDDLSNTAKVLEVFGV